MNENSPYDDYRQLEMILSSLMFWIRSSILSLRVSGIPLSHWSTFYFHKK